MDPANTALAKGTMLVLGMCPAHYYKIGTASRFQNEQSTGWLQNSQVHPPMVSKKRLADSARLNATIKRKPLPHQ
jgi:hypothetical protein